MEDPALAEVPFIGRRHIVWSNPSASVVFAGWQSTDGDDPVISRWHEARGGLTAFTGHVWPRTGPWRPGRSWAERLDEYLRVHPLDTGTDELLGVFTALCLDASGTGILSTDPLGLGISYHAESDGLVVLSSRAAVAARLAAAGTGISSPRRDVIGSCWLAYSLHPLGYATGYEGVEALPPAAIVRFDPVHGAGIEVPSRPWRFGDASELDPRSYIDDLCSDIAGSIRTGLSIPAERHIMNLTGGKDSRLVFAVALSERLADQFEYRTFGSPNLPDVLIARDIASTFGLRHQIGGYNASGRAWREARNNALNERGLVSPPDRETEMRLTVGSHLGMRNVCEPHTSCPPHGDRVVLSGQAGEVLRTMYPGSSRFRSAEQLDMFFRVDLAYGMAGILKPEAHRHYNSELWRLAFDEYAAIDAPQDVVDSFYLRYRLRRWFGTWREVDEENSLFPLYSPIGMRAAFQMPVSDRQAEWFHHEITLRASEKLAAFPFAKGAWTNPVTKRRLRASRGRGEPPAVPPLRDPSPFATRQARPPARTVRQDQREQMESVDVSIMRRYLVDDPPNPIRDVVDGARVAALLERFGDLTESAKRQVYGALSAAIWLGDAEISYRGAREE